MSGDKIKELPSSSEAEQALLGCIIQGGEREQEIAMAWIRDNNAFYTTDNKHIWKSMSELYKDGTEIGRFRLARSNHMETVRHIILVD